MCSLPLVDYLTKKMARKTSRAFFLLTITNSASIVLVSLSFLCRGTQKAEISATQWKNILINGLKDTLWFSGVKFYWLGLNTIGEFDRLGRCFIDYTTAGVGKAKRELTCVTFTNHSSGPIYGIFRYAILK